MSKIKSLFFCNNCGYESQKWLGKCPACNEWNTFVEEKVSDNKNGRNIKEKKSINPVTINSIEKKTSTRCNTGFSELDRVLGGGVVEGSLILLRW